jgi:hypothetical protein
MAQCLAVDVDQIIRIRRPAARERQEQPRAFPAQDAPYEAPQPGTAGPSVVGRR